jgi:hypothetical protein
MLAGTRTDSKYSTSLIAHNIELSSRPVSEWDHQFTNSELGQSSNIQTDYFNDLILIKASLIGGAVYYR